MPGETETLQSRGTGRWGTIADIPADKRDWPRNADSGQRQGKGQDLDGSKPAYYDISMLKPPVWTPEVGQYFFLGGLSAYAFIFSRLAERLGGPEYKDLTRWGTAVAAATALPCAPLLIWDLGDRKRFHHMLRVWKPSSPMNLGSWTLTAYTAVGGLVALREIARARRGDKSAEGVAKAFDVAAGVLGDAVGAPLGALLATYTGILLSTTATPVWSKNPWIGVLFSASAAATGAGAVRVVLELKSAVTGADEKAATDALAKIETASHLAEAASHVGFLMAAGTLAKPLTEGKLKAKYWGGAVAMGVVLPEIVSRLPVPAKAKPWAKIAAGVIGLVGGYLLRSAFVAAGKPSAEDPDAARAHSKAKNGGPWEG